MQCTKTIFLFSQNIISLFFVKGIDLVLNLILIPYLIIKIGMINYGVYVFALAMVMFLVNMLNYGFDLSVVRDLAKNKNDSLKVKQLFNEVFSVKLFLLGIVYVIIFILVSIVPRFIEGRIVFLLASSLLIGDLFSLRWFFLGMEKMKFITAISLLSTLIYATLVLIFIQQEGDYIWIPVMEAIGLFVVSFISFLVVLKKFHIEIELLGLKEITNYLKIHFYSYMNLLIPSTSGVLIIFLVGLFGVPNNVALMQIGVKFTAAFSTVNTVLTTVFYPMVNREQKNTNASRITLLTLGFCFSIAMYLSCGWLITHWLKFENQTDFENTIIIIKYLSPIPFLMGIISSYGVNGLLIFFEDKIYCWITFGATLVMVLFAIILVPIWPISGGVIAFLISRTIYAITLYIVNMEMHIPRNKA